MTCTIFSMPKRQPRRSNTFVTHYTPNYSFQILHYQRKHVVIKLQAVQRGNNAVIFAIVPTIRHQETRFPEGDQSGREEVPAFTPLLSPYSSADR